MTPLINADKSWVEDLEFVFKYGNHVSPRGMLCLEALALRSVISMANPIILNSRRRLGYKFMAAEAAWIISGRNDVASISQYSKDISKFSDDGITFYGAYGPRFRDQYDYVLGCLKKDIDSRQALATIWRQNPEQSKDIPCTVALQWLVRHGSIHCVATMRSSDLWLGHPYDIFNFSAMSFYLMLELNKHLEEIGKPPLALGNLFLTAGSKHVYDKNAMDVAEIIKQYSDQSYDQAPAQAAFRTERYDSNDEFLQDLWEVANGGGALALLVP